MDTFFVNQKVRLIWSSLIGTIREIDEEGIRVKWNNGTQSWVYASQIRSEQP